VCVKILDYCEILCEKITKNQQIFQIFKEKGPIVVYTWLK
jgi:hypothetical protein